MRAPRILSGALLVAAGLAFTSGGPAQADYAPFIVLDPTAGPPGTVITVSSDSAGRCGAIDYTEQGPVVNAAGTVTVELGRLDQLPDIGGMVVLDEVLASTTVDADPVTALWSTTLTVPEGVTDPVLYVTGHCDVPEADSQQDPSGTRALLFDYYPAKFEVTVDDVQVTEPTIPPTTEPTSTEPAAAEPVESQANFTG